MPTMPPPAPIRAAFSQASLRAENNGYRPGQHADKDETEPVNYDERVMKQHDNILWKYVGWQIRYRAPDMRDLRPETAWEYFLKEGTLFPEIKITKDFFRFWVSQSTSQITKNGRATRDSLLTNIEHFFAGFERHTKTEILKDTRQNIYQWVRKELCEKEKAVENIRRPKHNFGENSLNVVMTHLWCYTDPIFIHERYRMNVSFLVPIYCWSGARIAAFFNGNGLTYKDIEMDLKRAANGEIKLCYRLDQRWVKNNKDPENVMFGTAGTAGGTQFMYDETNCLVSMALADGALHGVKTWDEVTNIDIPNGRDHIKLRWTDEALNRPILRRVNSQHEVTHQPMTIREFQRIWSSLLVACGYHTIGGIHMIRRALGAAISARYEPVYLAQHLTQADVTVFGRSYVANTSSVDGKAAFLGQKTDHDAVHHFQGVERFREPGYPVRLPTAIQKKIQEDDQLRDLKFKLSRCHKNSKVERSLQRELSRVKFQLERHALEAYRKDWTKQNELDMIQGKANGTPQETMYQPHPLLTVLEARRTLSQLAMLKRPPTKDENEAGRNAQLDLLQQDLSVIYRPGEYPTDGKCPVCGQCVTSIPPRSRSQHIHGCRRKQAAEDRRRKTEDLRYCYACFEWFTVGYGEWSSHCDTHHTIIGPFWCDRVTYSNSTIREYRCGGCGHPSTPEELRLKDYTPKLLWEHIESHHKVQNWPSRCMYFGCSVELNCQQKLDDHLRDCHYPSRRTMSYQRGRFSKATAATSPSAANDDAIISEYATTPVLAPHLESLVDPEVIKEPLPAFPTSWEVTTPPLLTSDPGFKELLPAPPQEVGAPRCTSTSETGITSPETPHPHPVNSNEAETTDAIPPPSFLDLVDPTLRAYPSHTRPASSVKSSETEKAAQLSRSHPSLSENRAASNIGSLDSGPPPSSEDQYEVEEVLAFAKGWYLIKWKDYDDDHNVWIQAADIDKTLVQKYHESGKMNDCGNLTKKRKVRGETQYLMKWNRCPPGHKSWLSEKDVSADALERFNEVVQPAKRRRTKRSRQ